MARTKTRPYDSADYLDKIVREARALVESEYRAQIVAWDWDVSPVSNLQDY